MNISDQYKKNLNLNSKNVKNKILHYLYSRVNVDLKHEIISNEKDLDNIRNNEYIICPRFDGTRSWIMFFQLDDIFYAVNFPKHNQRKKMELIIHPIDICVLKEFYNGTIMEGIFFRMDINKYLVIDEVYYLSGQNQLLKSKDDRLDNLSQYITKYTTRTPTYQMYVSKYFQINKKNLRELYDKIKADVKIQEIIFYPKIFGRKIYNYTIIDEDLIDNIIKFAQFILQKTNSPDVYNLLSIKSKNKIGMAYIPTMNSSKTIKRWFKDYKSKELIVKCQLDPDKKKWIPIEVVEKDVDNIDDNEDKDKDIVEI